MTPRLAPSPLLLGLLAACGHAPEPSDGHRSPTVVTIPAGAVSAAVPASTAHEPSLDHRLIAGGLPEAACARRLTLRPLPAAQQACVTALPRRDARTLSLNDAAFEHPLEILWLLQARPGSCPANEPSCVDPPTSQAVFLQLRRHGLTSRPVSLGQAVGHALPADVSACLDQPRGTSVCSYQKPPPYFASAHGVLAELGVVSTYGYIEQTNREWLLVQEEKALLVIESTHPSPDLHEGLCAPGAARVVVVIPEAGRGPVEESVFVSSPAAPSFAEIDCAAAWEREGRCTG